MTKRIKLGNVLWMGKNIVKSSRMEFLNKAVYTTASVACGWTVAGVNLPFGVFLHCVTNGWTDRPMDGQTDRVATSRES